MSAYEKFLAGKARTAGAVGRRVADADVNPFLHPWQRRVVEWAVGRGRAALWEDTGLGKALDSETLAVTPSGMVAMRDLRPGDFVMGANGRPTRVVGVFPQGEREGYRVTFSDDASVVCDNEHLWAVRKKADRFRGKDWRVITLREIQSRGLGGDGDARSDRWFIPMMEAAQFAETELPLHPYLLGCLIGDGHIKQRTPMISSADEDLIEHLREIVPLNIAIEKARYSKYDYRFTHNALNGRGTSRASHLVTALEELGLQGHGAEAKFIPERYKFAAADTRLLLLQGLMDTDGSVCDTHGTSVLEFCTVSPRLAEDFVFLVQSLGGKGRIREKQTTGRLAYRITPALPREVVPFLLKRKADRFKMRTKYMPARSIRSVEPTGQRDMTCIKVEAEDGLFVVDGFIVTHNTVQEIEFARLSGARSLIIAPLAVCAQTVREAAKLGVICRYVRSDEDAEGPGIWITNYEMATRFDAGRLDAVVLDEASILKQSDGKTRTALIRHFAATPARLTATATPAPNDMEELTSQAEFLGITTRPEMLAAYFVHDDEGWRLKGHAREPMFRWMATWAVALSRPSDIGGSDDGYLLPGLDVIPHLIDVDVIPEGQLFATDLGGVGGRAQIRKATLDARCELAAKLVIDEPDEPWLLWCGLNAEADRLAALIPDAVNVHGSMTPEEKAEHLLAFSDGKIRVLITKPSLAQFGMNWQHCARMAFVGLSDSYEAYYQSIRRCYRYGQPRRVKAHVVLSEVEGRIAENVARKEKHAAGVTQELVAAMRAAGELRIS